MLLSRIGWDNDWRQVSKDGCQTSALLWEPGAGSVPSHQMTYLYQNEVGHGTFTESVLRRCGWDPQESE